MKLEQSFEVTAPLQRVWPALIDVERLAECLPGAAVSGRDDDGSYNGTFKVRIGPTSALYSGKLQMEEIDEDAHTATMRAAGTDKRGQGGAKATIIFSALEAGQTSTKVDVATDYQITGRLARFGRGGMLEEISNRLLGEFVESLQAMLAGAEEGEPVPDAREEPEAIATAEVLGVDADPSAPGPADVEPPASVPASTQLSGPVTPTPSPPESEPVEGLSLMVSALWSQAKRNPLPLLTALFGFLVALRVFRRRT